MAEHLFDLYSFIERICFAGRYSIGVPKALLRHISEALSLTGTSIATLRSIYKRRETLYDHQKWARLQASLELPDPSSDAELRRA